MKKQMMITYPLNKLSKVVIPQKKKKGIEEKKFVIKLFITSHNKNQ